ncbi:Hypothetical predicted protein [Prunus dulcis]|uniref:Uncharacterized protein n=1 Tax=Prunus dulcis TaxID=3755 RepID=A0A5E4EUI6_PRUDU|nr:Hypothetical predicted protein [Prunus dulcis]
MRPNNDLEFSSSRSFFPTHHRQEKPPRVRNGELSWSHILHCHWTSQGPVTSHNPNQMKTRHVTVERMTHTHVVRSNQIWPLIFLSSNPRPRSSIQSCLNGGGSPVSSAVRLPSIAVSASQPVSLSGGLCNVANWQSG